MTLIGHVGFLNELLRISLSLSGQRVVFGYVELVELLLKWNDSLCKIIPLIKVRMETESDSSI